MSKSLGNVILAKHFYQKYSANTLRYLILNSPYNQVINLSKELIQQATDYIQKIKNLLKKLNFYLYIEKIEITPQEAPKKEELINGLLNNLNTIKVLFFLEQTINSLNKSIDKKESDSKELQKMVDDFYFILDLLGFKFDFIPYNFATKLLIKQWQDLRERSDYDQADLIRRKLQELDAF